MLGRACDTDDLWMNSLGAMGAALLAAGVLSARSHRGARFLPADDEHGPGQIAEGAQREAAGSSRP